MEIVIRKAKKGDAKHIAECYRMLHSRNLDKYMNSNQNFSKEKIKKLDNEFLKKDKMFCTFVAINNDKIMGFCNFKGNHGRTRHRVECGWMVHPDYFKRGIATKLLNNLVKEARRRGFKKIEAEASVNNIASIKLAKKVGFEIEGKKRRGLMDDNGTYSDTFIFGKCLN